jgi:hypothetical protein
VPSQRHGERAGEVLTPPRASISAISVNPAAAVSSPRFIFIDLRVQLGIGNDVDRI